MLQSVAVLDFCSVKYSCSCGTTCIISKKSPTPPRFIDWLWGIISFWFSPHSSSNYFVPGIVSEAGCVQISQVSVLKSSWYCNSFLVSQCCVFLLKWSLPRSPPCELKCFKDPSLIMFYRCPQKNRGPSGPMPGRVKAPKHKIAARWPVRWVMARRWLHCKWPVFPVGGSKEFMSVFCTPSVGHNGRECPSKALSKGLAQKCHLEEQQIATKTV